jgi:hypothetical protein
MEEPLNNMHNLLSLERRRDYLSHLRSRCKRVHPGGASLLRFGYSTAILVDAD